MKKRVIFSIIGLMVVLLGATGVWAYRSGKLSGLADAVQGDSFRGVVISARDTSGQGVAGMLVRAYSADSTGTWQEASYLNGYTNSNGYFNIPAGSPICTQATYITKFKFKGELSDYSVSPDFSPEISVANFCNSRTTIDFTVSSSGSSDYNWAIYGTIYDTDTGSPISGANIAIQNAAGAAIVAVKSKSSGTYDLRYAGSDSLSDAKLVAARSGYEGWERSISPKSSNTYNIDIGLKALNLSPGFSQDTFKVYIGVVNEDGKWVGDVGVDITSDDIEGAWWGMTGTVASNSCEKGEANSVIMKLPLPKSTNNVYHFKGDLRTYNTKFDVNLDFDTSKVYFDSSANAYIYYEKVVWPNAEADKFNLVGEIKDGVTGKPIDGASISIDRVYHIEGRFYFNVGKKDLTGQNGKYQIKDLYKQLNYIYEIKIEHTDYFPIYYRLQISDQDIDCLVGEVSCKVNRDYIMQPKAGDFIAGQVMDATNSKAITDAVLELQSLENLAEKSRFTKSDSTGYFKFDNVAPGQYRVVASHSGYLTDSNSRVDVQKLSGIPATATLSLNVVTDSSKTFDLTIEDIVDKDTGKSLLSGNEAQYCLEVFSYDERGVFKGSNIENCGDNISLGFPKTIKKIPVGKIKVYFRSPTFVQNPYPLTFLNQSEDTKTVTIFGDYYGNASSRPGYIVTGNVYLLNVNDCASYSYGAPYNNYMNYVGPDNVTVKLIDSKGKEYGRATTDDYGIYQVVLAGTIPKGTYTLIAESDLYRGRLDDVEIDQNRYSYSYDMNIELGLKNSQEGELDRILDGKPKIHFVGKNAQQYIDQFDWHQIKEKVITSLTDYSNINSDQLPPIYIVDSGLYNAFYSNEDDCPTKDAIVMTTKFLEEIIQKNGFMRNFEIVNTLTHELGHWYDVNFLSGKEERKILETAYRTVVDNNGKITMNCLFDRLTDSNVISSMLPGGHPWDNDWELFASFFSAYFSASDKLKFIVDSLPDGECKYTLIYLGKFFDQHVGQKNLFDNYPATKLGIIPLSEKQITNGQYLNINYEKLSPKRRAQLQYKKIVSVLAIAKNFNRMMVALQSTNYYLNKLWKWRSTGSVEVTVLASKVDGSSKPMKDVIVYAGTLCVTSTKGRCTLNDVGVGNQKLQLWDQKTASQLSAFSTDGNQIKKISIKKNQLGEITIYAK
jgi:hypothetical protein